MQLDINIAYKIARAAADYKIVCGNSDYTIKFTFDSEWHAHEVKTARFAFTRNGESKHIDVVFTGDVCEMPVLSNITAVEIGVFAGDLQTTTPCILACEKSILCKDGAPEAPAEDVYNQITELCNEAVTTAQNVETRANAGEFNGKDGKDGKDGEKGDAGKSFTYEDMTDEQKADLLKDTYTKQEANEMFAEKEHTHPTASCKDVPQERVSLVDITTITQQGADAYPFIHENYLEVSGTDEAIFFVDCKGNTDIEIKATGTMWNNPLDGCAFIYVDGKPLEGESISYTEAKYTYNGNINDGITLRGTYITFDFIKFSGIAREYTDGFMSGQQAEKLALLEKQVGDFDTALDELHNYAQTLITGGNA